jgi:hypothetical protein
MRHIFYSLIIVSLFSCINKFDQSIISIDLSGYWKFKTGDNLDWANPSCNDSEWDSIKGPYYWETQGYEGYDGFAWYRKKVNLPLEMRRQAYHDTIVFDFGKIDDCCQIYINGKIVSISPHFNKDCGKDYAVYHLLHIPAGTLKWDSMNIIAIRVCDALWSGGLSNPNMNISPLKDPLETATVTAITIDSCYVKNEALVLKQSSEFFMAIRNNTGRSIKATAEYYILNSNSDTTRRLTMEFELQDGLQGYSFAFMPDVPGFYYITYRIRTITPDSTTVCGRLYCGNAEGVISEKPFDKNKFPVIYSSDLFHPHGDPDDHFDLASVLAPEEFDLRCILLDEGQLQKKKCGIIPVVQMKHITQKSFPVFFGLKNPLKSFDDKALDQPSEYQGGISMILKTLEESPVPVSLLAVGSMKDFAAAYNRDPELFHRKAARLFIFAGDAHDPVAHECNVVYDTCAYICLMNSGLPLYWVPCFHHGSFGKNASVWISFHNKVLKYSSDKFLNYIAYMMCEKNDPDILGYIDHNQNQKEKDIAFYSGRWLYGAALFTIISGREIVKRNNDYYTLPKSSVEKGDVIIHPFELLPVKIYTNDRAVVQFENSARSNKAEFFQIMDSANYPQIMTSATANLLRNIR